MAIVFSPLPPYDVIVIVIAICAASMVCLYALLLSLNRLPRFASPYAFGQKRGTQMVSISLTLLSFVLLVLTAHNPLWVEQQKSTGSHIVITIDVSESVLRSFDNWEVFKRHISKKLNTLQQYQGQNTKTKGLASLVLFTDQATVAWQAKTFEKMLSSWQQINQTDMPAGTNTSIEEGLKTALEAIEDVGRSSAIILFTDGHQINGNAAFIAKQIAASGTPIYPVAMNARLPAVAIQAANLNDNVIVEQTTYLRGLLVNHQTKPIIGELTVIQNFGTQDVKQSRLSLTLKPNEQGIIRQAVKFNKRGLNHLTLDFDQQDNNQPHIRRLYTLVKGPAKILSIAGDRRWESALPEASITPVTAESLTIGTLFSDYDGIVISAVIATDFKPGVLDKIATAVKENGTGLLLINGTQFDVERPTVLMSYNNTPIDPLLPVSSQPRPEHFQPPTRNIVIMIDASGSMGGAPMAQAKKIASYVIDTYMRPQDTLDLIAFNSTAQHLVINKAMNKTGKALAQQQLTNISADGSTDPTDALALINGRTMDECGLIFISDGEFGAIAARPDCAATAFGIGMSSGESSQLSAIAEPIIVDSSFDPKRIKIKYFEPQTRDKFFESGNYKPASIKWRSHLASSVPALELNGSAVSYLRTGAELVAIRPKWRDPVLAYIQQGNGYVGCFATALPTRWLNDPKGRKAIKQWVDEILSFSEQQRYKINITDLGDKLKFKISVFKGEKGEIVAKLDNIQALIKINGQQTLLIAFSQHPDEAGTFIAELKLNEVTKPGAGMLYISETGSDALPREQRIPINLVTTKQVRQTQSEGFSSGTNYPLLQKLAYETGGQVLAQLNQDIIQYQPQRIKQQPLWSIFAAFAMIFYLLAIALTRLGS